MKGIWGGSRGEAGSEVVQGSCACSLNVRLSGGVCSGSLLKLMLPQSTPVGRQRAVQVARSGPPPFAGRSPGAAAAGDARCPVWGRNSGDARGGAEHRSPSAVEESVCCGAAHDGGRQRRGQTSLPRCRRGHPPRGVSVPCRAVPVLGAAVHRGRGRRSDWPLRSREPAPPGSCCR